MNPFASKKTYDLAARFYQKYYHDSHQRWMCFGINPGRFGAGVTGVPFTDPIRLAEVCGIANDLEKKAELSSRFIYEMIAGFGEASEFYRLIYITAISPLGFLKEGINLNYYDIKGYKTLFEDYVVQQIREQLSFGIHTNVAFSIGRGKNVEYLRYINQKYGFFREVVALSHPRWVMQYRLKRKEEFIQEYLEAFSRLSP